MRYVIAVLLLFTSVWGKNVDPADFPLKGHLKSAQFHHVPNGSYTPGKNGTLGKWSYGALNTYMSEIQVDKKVYTADDICKWAKVGEDYPTRLDRGRLYLLVGNKVCRYAVTGERDITGD